jgi:hypothetical protein
MALLFGAAMVPSASPAFAGAPREPLIVTEVADPDPGFVPPREPRRKARPASARKTAKPTMNQVMEDLGRVTGQLELLGEQIQQTHRGTRTEACTGAQDQSDCSQ